MKKTRMEWTIAIIIALGILSIGFLLNIGIIYKILISLALLGLGIWIDIKMLEKENGWL